MILIISISETIVMLLVIFAFRDTKMPKTELIYSEIHVNIDHLDTKPSDKEEQAKPTENKKLTPQL